MKMGYIYILKQTKNLNTNQTTAEIRPIAMAEHLNSFLCAAPGNLG